MKGSTNSQAPRSTAQGNGTVNSSTCTVHDNHPPYWIRKGDIVTARVDIVMLDNSATQGTYKGGIPVATGFPKSITPGSFNGKEVWPRDMGLVSVDGVDGTAGWCWMTLGGEMEIAVRNLPINGKVLMASVTYMTDDPVSGGELRIFRAHSFVRGYAHEGIHERTTADHEQHRKLRADSIGQVSVLGICKHALDGDGDRFECHGNPPRDREIRRRILPCRVENRRFRMGMEHLLRKGNDPDHHLLQDRLLELIRADRFDGLLVDSSHHYRMTAAPMGVTA